jgi:hypothetical protein
MTDSQRAVLERIQIRGYIEQFPKYAYKDVEKKFKKMKIGVTGDLLRDLSITARRVGNYYVPDILVEINYYYYGMFPDLGVGNGVKMEDVAVSKLVGYTRKRKNWTRWVSHTKWRLLETYTPMVADHVSQHINRSLDRSVQIRLGIG